MDSYLKPLTKKQSDVLKFIKTNINNESIAPTLQEICQKFKFSSTNSASDVLKALEQKGYIKRKTKGMGRGIILLDNSNESTNASEQSNNNNITSVTILGKGNSDDLNLFYSNKIGEINLDKKFFKGNDLFASYIPDDGLSSIGFTKGDLIILQKCKFEELENEFVLALVNDQNLFRQFVKNNDSYELKAFDKGYPKIKFKHNEEGIAIVGKMVSLIKKNS